MGRFDVVVIGGGPAGLAASIAAARAGLSVMLADARQPPIDKLCGEGILPDGLATLSALGVDLSALEKPGVPFDGISFHDGQSSFAAGFPGHAGLGVRRTALHAALHEAALREGVTLRWQKRAEMSSPGMVRLGDRVGGEQVRCRYIIGADGQCSVVRHVAGLSGSSTRSRLKQRVASGRHYACASWSGFVEVYWSGGTQAYVTPVGPQEVGVAFISKDSTVRTDDCLHLFPELRERLAGVATIGRVQGSTSISLRLPRVVSRDGASGTALVGEASGSVDAITGEGITLLLRQAIALADAMRAGDLGRYQREHPRILRRARFMSQMLLSLSEFPQLRGRVFRAFADEPAAFENLLAMHVGQRPRLFGPGGCFGLGKRLMVPRSLPPSLHSEGAPGLSGLTQR